MNSLEIQLQSLVDCLAAQRIEYVILGGIAVSIYGEPRLTVDTDINIIFDRKEIDLFLKNAKSYGFYPFSSDTKKIVEESGIIPLYFKKGRVTGKFDIIIAENPLEFTAIKRGRIKRIASVKAKVISPEDLIIHKITSSRPRDIEDLRGIIVRQRNKLDIHYIKGWLKKIDKIDKKNKIQKLFDTLLNNAE